MAQRESSTKLRLFNRDKSPLAIYFLLLILCLIIMKLGYKNKILKKIRVELPIIIAPINNLINLPINLIHETQDNFITKVILKEKIDNLENTIYALSIQIQENTLLKSENNILRDLLKIQKTFKITGENAEIVLPKVRNGHSIITINKGLNNNIEEGAAVINNAGLVGQVINTYSEYSEIRSITSKYYAVPAIINSAKENIILYGNGNGELEIPLSPASSSIQINDTLMTSGIDDLYPKGIKIGTVTKIKKTKSPKFNYIVVKPFSHPTTYSQITVLTIKK